MPSITTTMYPTPAYVRVEVNWSDVPSAVGVKVERVDCSTGARTALRPYVSYDGDYLDLSCGFGLFWDTEAPLDRCFYYCTTAEDANGNVIVTATAPVLADTFTRTVVDGWSSADTGQPYTLSGTAANFDVTAGVGTQTHTAVNALQLAYANTSTADQEIQVDNLLPVASATGANISVWVLGRVTDANNYYTATINLTTTGTVQLFLQKRVAGVLTNFGGAVTVGSGHTATDWWTIKFRVWGTQLMAKAWLRTTAEPAAWQVTQTDTSLVTGTFAGAGGRLESGNTNTLPVIFSFDNLSVTNPGALTQVIQTCSGNLTVPSESEFRYGDPVRPCNDVILRLNPTADPACVPTQGIFFGNMDAETFASNSGSFLPVNADTLIGIVRTRMKQSSILTVATRTFMDRDALRTLHKPGSQTFLRTPAQYGVDDRYMLVADVTENRPMADHKIQPRAVTIPHVLQSRAWGPSQGVCGTRIQDLCDQYATLGALEASGLSWADVLRGSASPDSPKPISPQQNWNGVNSTNADWNAVNSGNSNWTDLLDGP